MKKKINGADLKASLKMLFTHQPLAVLATDTGVTPYTSLVAFAAEDDLRHIFFATTRSTQKFANIQNNPRVSLLIDNRSNQVDDFRDAMAATVLGVATELKDSQRAPARELYLAKHPFLKEFVTSPTCALMRVEVQKYLVVSRFQNVTVLKMQP